MDRSPLNHRRGQLAVALFVGVWTFSAAITTAAEDPNSKPVGEHAQSGEPLTPSGAPIATPNGDRLDPGVLTPLEVRMDPLYHLGGLYTDSGAGSINELNELELDKFAAARAAIEASRAAGTLYLTELPIDTVPATPEDVEQMKLDQLRAQQPIVVESDPVAGIGEYVATEGLPTDATTEMLGDYGPLPQPLPVADTSEMPAPEGVSSDE